MMFLSSPSTWQAGEANTAWLMVRNEAKNHLQDLHHNEYGNSKLLGFLLCQCSIFELLDFLVLIMQHFRAA